MAATHPHRRRPTSTPSYTLDNAAITAHQYPAHTTGPPTSAATKANTATTVPITADDPITLFISLLSLRSLLGMDTRRTLPFMFASTLPRHHTDTSTRHSPGSPATAGRKSTHAQTAPPPIPAPPPQDKIGRYNSLPHCARGHCPTHANFCQDFFMGNYGRPPYLTGEPSFSPQTFTFKGRKKFPCHLCLPLKGDRFSPVPKSEIRDCSAYLITTPHTIPHAPDPFTLCPFIATGHAS